MTTTLQLITCPILESCYYCLSGSKGKVLLEFDIEKSGRKIDYLKLDRFWGDVARPFLDGATVTIYSPILKVSFKANE